MKVAIVGYDVEGQESYRHFKRRGADITIFDEAAQPRAEPPAGVPVIAGPGALEQLRQAEFDAVVRTAGLSPHKLEGVSNVTTATREFFKDCPVPIIGVTGTKGKGTTCSLIASILKAAGKKVHLVGNIGLPALKVLPDIKDGDIVVYELSSFQLWDTDASPHIAVILKIEPDHLDVHTSLDEYVMAKANIRRFQDGDDVCYYHPTNELSAKAASVKGDWVQNEEEKKIWAENAIRYGAKDVDSHYPVAYVEDNKYFAAQGRVICPISLMSIPGAHNVENACAAISVALHYTADNQAISKGLHDFTGLPHRLKFVREVNGVEFYDDSIATTPGSAIAALAAFTKPKVLMLGGSEKGVDYRPLAEAAAQANDSLRAVITFGQTGPRIAADLKRAGVEHVTELSYARTIDEVVVAAVRFAKPGDVVILSPASASFDMFKSYADRGEQFVAAVSRL